MCTCRETDLDTLAGEIQRYLLAHRDAADTRQGIALWWIKQQRLAETQARVQGALDLLVARSEIVAQRTAAGVVLYRLPHGETDTAGGA